MTVALDRLPGIPRLALGHATGEPDVTRFLGERATATAIAARATAVLAAFVPRDGADPALAALAAGRRAGVLTGSRSAS